MIRGLQKQMIQLATPKSKHFEVVFFVLRSGLVRTKESEGEMVREAQKILSESLPPKKIKEKAGEKHAVPKRQKLAFFFFGIFCGSLLSTVLIALLAALR